MIIINVRGTHGSGKSTLVRSVLNRYPNTHLGTGKKPDGYKVSIPWLPDPLYVVGSYETACGGCDGIQPYSLIWPRVENWAASGNVLFEGALVSNSYGTIGAASEGYGDRFVFAFLDTPVDVCLTRINARRLVRGEQSPVNPHHCERIHKSNATVMGKVKGKNRRYEVLDHRRPLPQLLGLLLKSIKGK